jgi:hypothetical protein
MAGLSSLTVARLDELASEHGVLDYPADGLKADKVEALEEALGSDYEVDEKPTYVLGVADGYNGVQFQAGQQHVELEAGDTFETTDALLYESLRGTVGLDHLSEEA